MEIQIVFDIMDGQKYCTIDHSKSAMFIFRMFINLTKQIRSLSKKNQPVQLQDNSIVTLDMQILSWAIQVQPKIHD